MNRLQTFQRHLLIVSCSFLALGGCADLGPGGFGFLLASAVASGDSGDTTTTIASPLMGMQRNITTMTATSETVTVTSVDMTKSVLFCGAEQDSSNPTNVAVCRLTSANQVTLSARTANNQEVAWHLVEFASGASVQRGQDLIAVGDTLLDITITAVDTAKTFVLVYSRGLEGVTTDERRTMRAELTSSTNLRLTRNESGTQTGIVWQVVQLDGATVQSGLKTLSTLTDTVSITAVDTASSFLVFNGRAAAAVDGIDNQYMTRGMLTNSTTLTFTRESATNSVDLSWFVVTLEGASVQTGAASSFDVDHLNLDSTLATAVDTARTVPLVTSSITGTANGDLDAGRYSGYMTTTTNLQASRSGPDSVNAQVEWFAVQLATE